MGFTATRGLPASELVLVSLTLLAFVLIFVLALPFVLAGLSILGLLVPFSLFVLDPCPNRSRLRFDYIEPQYSERLMRYVRERERAELRMARGR